MDDGCLKSFDWAFEKDIPLPQFTVELALRAKHEREVIMALVKLCREAGLQISDIAIIPKEGK